MLNSASDVIINMSTDNKSKRAYFIMEIEKYLIEAIVMSSITAITTDNDYVAAYRKIRGDKPLSPDDLFMGIFEDADLRSLIFRIMPSDIDFEIITPPVNNNPVINKAVSIFVSYCNNYIRIIPSLLNMIKNKYHLNDNVNPIYYTLNENIIHKKWPHTNVRYYIISIYDNDIPIYSRHSEFYILNIYL